MMLNDSGVFAFGGGPLVGGNLARNVYLDESGTGDIRREPHLVVAGVIVNTDQRLIEVSRALYKILHLSVPKGKKVPPYLHAKDIYHGNKSYNNWSDERRRQILTALSLVPLAHQCTVVYGVVDRVSLAKEMPLLTAKQQDEAAYSMAAVQCILQVERFMREKAAPGEIAQLTFEAGVSGAKAVKDIARYLKTEECARLLPDGIKQYLPVSRIIDIPSFQEKSDASALQLADYCAYALRRREAGAKDWEWMCDSVLKVCFGTWSPGRERSYG